MCVGTGTVDESTSWYDQKRHSDVSGKVLLFNRQSTTWTIEKYYLAKQKLVLQKVLLSICINIGPVEISSYRFVCMAIMKVGLASTAAHRDAMTNS